MGNPIKNTILIPGYTTAVIPGYSPKEVQDRKLEKEDTEFFKQLEQMRLYNEQHPDQPEIWNYDKYKQAVAQDYRNSHPVSTTGVMLGDDFSVLQRLRQHQADTATAVDIATGKDAQKAATTNQWNYVGKPALKEAGMGAGMLATAASIPTIGIPATIGGVIGSDIAGKAGYKLGSKIDDKYNTNWVAPTAGLVTGALAFPAGAAAGKYSYNIARIADPKYRALHAYNAITPLGYQDFVQRGKLWVKDMVKDNPVDLDNPAWLKHLDNQKDLTALGVTSDSPMVKYRIEAWRKYLGLPEKDGLYVKNNDGTFSYDLSKTDNNVQLAKGVSLGMDPKADYLTGNGGHLWKDSGLQSDGTYFMHDVWDLHPLSRGTDELKESLYQSFGDTRLRQIAQNFREKMYDKGYWGNGKYSKLDHILNEYRTGYKFNKETGEITVLPSPINKALSKVVDTVEPKIQNFEIGPILGGKPFELKMNVPTKRLSDGTLMLNPTK